MKPGLIIKHPRFMDVALLVHRVRGPYGPNQRMEVIGDWINLGFERSFLIGERQKIRKTKSYFDQWQVCLDPELTCLRNARWK